jgi:hypothetical protein
MAERISRWSSPFLPIPDLLNAEARRIFSFDAALTTGGGRHEHRSVDIDSASAVWGWFCFEPVGGGTKIKVVLLKGGAKVFGVCRLGYLGKCGENLLLA